MTADILRKNFLDFFKSKKHKIVDSDSLVPQDDPTVLFTPAGMNQFKKQFLGYITDFRRAATAQRCLRTDDLDKVGKTAGHHTFFEMLGNFSFGDYFKQEAIAWAWEFLTQELKIKPERLWVSIYKDDAEADKIWKDLIKVPQDMIIKLGDKENFWPSQARQKGPNGPCGPCSEIFFDQGANMGCGRPDCSPACDCGRFVEVWNLVFTQFNRKDGGILEPLPKKNIDTGMGLERLAAVMQGVANNFETDLFQPIIKEILTAYSLQLTAYNRELIYAIADHLRAIVFAIYDGVLPSNEDRGYVVRKLIRRSTLHLRKLGFKKPFLCKLVPVLSQIMEAPYPELNRRKENIAEIILAEEKSFIRTLNSSPTLEKEANKSVLEMAKNDPIDANGVISAAVATSAQAGTIAFRLYDTYGIPLELTRDWWANKKIKFKQDYDDAIKKELAAQRNRSKSQSAMKGDVFDVKGLKLDVKETKFLGYKLTQTSAKILKIIKDDSEVKKVNKGDTVKIILDKTVFYAESGGQVGDTGELTKGKNIFEVLDTQKADKVIIHVGRVKASSFKKSDSVKALLDIERRLSIARNHTATHLLQAALRKVLGVHVRQQGSLVTPERLRFDFTHFKDIGRDELNRIEELTSNYIISNYPLKVRQMSYPEAKRQGALAFFGEKYESKVRVVSIGDVSRELCGGTHLNSTGQIARFKIIQECSVAAGVRRIEAITGNLAYKMIKQQEAIIADIASTLNVPEDKIIQEIEKKNLYIKDLEKQLDLHKTDIIEDSKDRLIKDAEEINGKRVITAVIENADMDFLRRSVDLIKKEMKNNTIVFSGTGTSSNCQVVIGVTEDLADRFDAVKLIKEIAPLIGGSGGGRKDFAQAGGNKPVQNLKGAFDKLKGIIRDTL